MQYNSTSVEIFDIEYNRIPVEVSDIQYHSTSVEISDRRPRKREPYKGQIKMIWGRIL